MLMFCSYKYPFTLVYIVIAYVQILTLYHNVKYVVSTLLYAPPLVRACAHAAVSPGAIRRARSSTTIRRLCPDITGNHIGLIALMIHQGTNALTPIASALLLKIKS